MSKEIAESAVISALADIETSHRGSRFVLGAASTIDAFVKVKYTGGAGDVIIGSNTHINSGTVIYSGNGIRLGNNVMVAANCTFAPTNHEYATRIVPMIEQRFRPSKGGIVVEDDVWIGAGAVLLDGAIVRRGAIVAAMTLVRGDVPEYAIFGGIPGVVIRSRPD